ncbi:VOC family protein [Mucilaginibacter boryungensis]|uniref:VOC family protein n=1 Tax=Mucilaginibacter boryungensis TaxID=768480 RepID=A0ABR9XML3_9SPHI|nr:VOC family protein [Mucilaginibacter boryungensis]MBE9668597.1 VOC family protein [Mucilaginibacter boryungensis]
MISFKQIDHIHICVPQERLEEARSFYADVIGLMEKPRPDVFGRPGHWFDIGGIELHIGVETPLPRTIRHSAFEVTDVKAAKAYLESKGVEIIWEPVIPGRERFAFIDPFGNRMELLQFV